MFTRITNITRITIMVLALLALSWSIAAQHTPALEPCDYDGLADRLEDLPDALRRSQTPRLTLLTWMGLIGTFRAECGGYHFESSEYGQNIVTEPIHFRDGVYRAHFSANAWATLRITPLTPGCPASYMFIPGHDSITRKSEAWVMESCIALLTFTGDDRWLLRMDMILDAAGFGEG